jgi:hypothetical protein
LAYTDVLPAASERRDFLAVLIQCLYVVAPLEILLIYVGTTKLTAGMATGALLGLVGLLLFASSRLSLSWRADRPMVYMFVFLALAAFSTVQTPYGAPAIQKGAINLIAMLAMVSMVLVVTHAFGQWPNLFPHVVRITAIMTGIAGYTVVLQSFLSNVLLQPQLFDLSFVNALVGEMWWEFTNEFGFVRAHGIFKEPASLATYVGIGSGLALVRLGVLGSKQALELRALVPKWAAAGILGGLILTFSTVVYAGLLAASFGALASRTTFGFRPILLFVVGSAAAILIVGLLALQAGDVIVQRIIGLAVFSQIGANESNALGTSDINLSVQVLFLNAYVTLQNLAADPLLGAGVGAHPFAFDALAPALPVLPADVASSLRTSTMDASALALRLLSETGILGTLMFTAAVLSAWFRVRRVALDASADAVDFPLKTIALALNGSLAGVFGAMMIRSPNYYGAEFWALLALCVAISALGSRVRHPDPPKVELGGYA